MAGSIGGGRGSQTRPPRPPAGGIEDAQRRMLRRTEQPPAPNTTRFLPHASQSEVQLNHNDRLEAIFHHLLMDFVKKVAEGYLKEDFISDQCHNALVPHTVDTIIAFESNRLPPTETLMKKYISDISY